MKNRFVWLIISCVMILSLVLASCAPAVTEEDDVVVEEDDVVEDVVEEDTEEVVEDVDVVEPGAEMVRDVLGRMVEKPQYGGTFTYYRPTTIRNWDYALTGGHTTGFITTEQLLMANWAQGPSGSNDAGWHQNIFPPHPTVIGALAESWERDGDTMIFNIRKGVKWQNRPGIPGAGEEVTAYDGEYNIRRYWSVATSYAYYAYPWQTHFEALVEDDYEGAYIKATDQWTLELRCLPGKSGFVYEMATGYHMRWYPPQAIEAFGGMADWTNNIATGPFYVSDFVPMSSSTYKSNDTYWGTHPLFPDMQMPFLDTIKMLVIQDQSTRLAALRTGKVDWAGGTSVNAIEWEDAEFLWETSPELKWNQWQNSFPPTVWWRVDQPEKPWYDLRVRQAMLLAIDQVAVGDALYQGDYELIGCPIGNLPELQDAFMSLDELPENVQELYGLDLDKAKSLLAEAGYPDGFQASVVAYAPQVDALAIVKDFWSKVGIDLTLDVKEYGVYSDISSALTHEDMFMSSCEGTIPHKFVNYTFGNTINKAMVDDPIINASKTETTAAYWDYAERMRLLKDINAYIQEQALGYSVPEGYQYFFWWPWVKGFSGEYSVGYYDGLNFPLWVWVDEDLKKEMGY